MLVNTYNYIYEYEIGALALYLIIMVRFLCTRRFENQKNFLFTVILWLSLVDVVLDIVTGFIIDNVLSVSLPIVYIVNTIFYSISILLLMFMALYTFVLTRPINRKNVFKILPIFIPGVILLTFLFSNPWTQLYFYVDQVEGYTRGPVFPIAYVVCVIYLIISFSIAMANIKKLRKIEFATIIIYHLLVLVGMLLQYVYPALLVSGVAILCSIILMYFTIQNPESMIDATTGAFTYEAMITFLNDCFREKRKMMCVAVKIENMSRISELLGLENSSLLLKEICNYLNNNDKNVWVFRMRSNSFIAMTRYSKSFAPLEKSLETRMAQPWVIRDIEILVQATLCIINEEKLVGLSIDPTNAINYFDSIFESTSSRRITNIVASVKLFEKVKRDGKVEKILREALEKEKGLELYFQPIWSINDKKYSHVEVLLRLNHPTMGIISPTEFIPIAEDHGLITAVDEFVIKKTCETMSKLDIRNKLGIDLVEINVSALEFMRSNLTKLLADTMSHYNIDPNQLCFEITETAATKSFDILIQCMKEIGEIGCNFALDDFGTGYANISQVIQLPFSIVKLDKSLLDGPSEVLSDLAQMFSNMGMETVIEGVETIEQDKAVKDMKIQYIQGFHYAKPLCESEFVQFLTDNKKR